MSGTDPIGISVERSFFRKGSGGLLAEIAPEVPVSRAIRLSKRAFDPARQGDNCQKYINIKDLDLDGYVDWLKVLFLITRSAQILKLLS